VIETNVSSSQLQIDNGVSLRLAAETRARVYESRLLLEKGIGQLESTHYRIEAASLVKVDGEVRLSSSGGVLIDRLDSGREMAFEPQESSAAATAKRRSPWRPRGGSQWSLRLSTPCEQSFDPFVEEEARTVGELVADARHHGRQ
jgi:hypothetical protein